MEKIKIAAVTGPTASGKTALAIALAKRLDGEIVSCDSMQIYRGMDVGTAKPTREELAEVPHHLIDILPKKRIERFIRSICISLYLLQLPGDEIQIHIVGHIMIPVHQGDIQFPSLSHRKDVHFRHILRRADIEPVSLHIVCRHRLIRHIKKFSSSHHAVMLEQQKGVLDINGDNAVKSFREKSISDGAPINAGYMVLNPEIFDYIEGDKTVFEREPLEAVAAKGELMSYMHKGFWQCMDNKREMDMLEKYLQTGTAPWKKWKD